MDNYPKIGVFRGRTMFQKRGSIGGARNVFVKLQGIKNELVYPTFGGLIKNPFKGDAKLFAGDLCWYKTNANGVRPEVYILKTFEVLSASSTTVNIKRDGYRHTPFVNDVLMLAPDVMGGTGTGVKLTAVTETTVTIDTTDYDVWQVTTSANIASSLSNGSILVEATATGAGAKMLVETVNSVADCDCDFFGTPSITSNTNITTASAADTDFDSVRFIYAPALGGVMYINKMSPMPQCVLNVNRSAVNGWFKCDYYDMRSIPDTNYVNDEIAPLKTLSGASDPTTSTVGAIGQVYRNTTDNGMFMCVNITGTTSKTYTWKEITFVS